MNVTHFKLIPYNNHVPCEKQGEGLSPAALQQVAKRQETKGIYPAFKERTWKTNGERIDSQEEEEGNGYERGLLASLSHSPAPQ